ncbi:MAG: polymer-forming cytoskeletal protein [Alphaproteobacteria bacterium]|nr:polymer-forming cytoskeletal protein [Alphaproteobacteria bacterium]
MFTRGKTPEAPPVTMKPLAPEPPKPRAATSRAAGPSIISADVKMKGSISSQGELQIDGHIEGDVRASALTIGDTGAVKGEVVAESVVVRGSIEGCIRGRKVQLCSGAKVKGDIFHASLAIEPNAVFEGAVKHAQDPTAEQPSSSSASLSSPAA